MGGVYCGSPSMSCPNFHVVPLCSYTCLPLPLFFSYWECPLCNQKNIILIPEYRQTTAEQERRQEETNISLFPYKAKVSKAIKEAIRKWLPVPGICVNSTVRCIFCNIKTNLSM